MTRWQVLNAIAKGINSCILQKMCKSIDIDTKRFVD